MKRWMIPLYALSFCFCVSNVYAEKPYVSMRALSPEMANKVAVSAFQACRKQGYQVAVAVVDRTGNLLAFLRDPLSGPHTISVSQGKAYTSATFQIASGDMADNPELSNAPRVLLIRGGLPIRVGGQFYGAVAVSGAPAKKKVGDADQECAQAGIDAIKDALEFAE